MKRLDHLLRAAFEWKASDVHLTVGVPPIMRINGELKRYGQEALRPEDTEEMAKAIVSSSLWSRFEEQGEIDFSYSIPCLLYTSPSPRDAHESRMPSSA